MFQIFSDTLWTNHPLILPLQTSPLNHPHLYNKVILPSPFLLPSYSSPRFSPLRRDNKVILYPFSPSRSKCIYVSMRVKFIGGQISFIGHFITFIVKKVPDPPPPSFLLLLNYKLCGRKKLTSCKHNWDNNYGWRNYGSLHLNKEVFILLKVVIWRKVRWHNSFE